MGPISQAQLRESLLEPEHAASSPIMTRGALRCLALNAVAAVLLCFCSFLEDL